MSDVLGHGEGCGIDQDAKNKDDSSREQAFRLLGRGFENGRLFSHTGRPNNVIGVPGFYEKTRNKK